VTAVSPPPQTAAELEVGRTPAADAGLVSDLLGETARRARVPVDDHASLLDLDSIERAFGRHLFDPRARSGIQAARARADRLAEGAYGPCEALAPTFAADLFVCLAVERPWSADDVQTLLGKLGKALGSSPEATAARMLLWSLRAPQLTELPPKVGLELQLSLLVALSPAAEASLWVKDEAGRPECLVSVGDTATTRRFRTVALRTLDAGRQGEPQGLILGVPVRRWQTPWAALVVRAGTGGAAKAWLEEAGEAASPLVEREFLLQRSAAREHALVNASERRLSRLGFDLHDGALQHVAALRADLRQMHVPELEQRAAELDRVLRELAHSLEPASLVRRPLERVIETEAAALRERTGIDLRMQVAGDFGAMTQSQKIALIRVVQEAFTNIREHSNATTVDVEVIGSRSSVDVQIQDDGDGFEVTRTLQDAAQRGRLGLVGSSERVRLLGGSFDIRSRPGGPTTVTLTLPRWQPLGVDESSVQAAY
jgi:signal transduction histidine kinase